MARCSLLASCAGQDGSSGSATSSTIATVTETVSPAPSSEATGTTTETTSEPASGSEEADFFARLESAGEDIPDDAQETVNTMGRLVCYSLDQGKDITWSGRKMMNNGFTMDQSGHVIG